MLLNISMRNITAPLLLGDEFYLMDQLIACVAATSLGGVLGRVFGVVLSNAIFRLEHTTIEICTYEIVYAYIHKGDLHMYG